MIDSDSAPDDSDFSADESSRDEDDSDDSDVELYAEFRPTVNNRELGEEWEEEATEHKVAGGKITLMTPAMCILRVFSFLQKPSLGLLCPVCAAHETLLGGVSKIWFQRPDWDLCTTGEGKKELNLVLASLLRLWDAFELPANPLDQLTELLGGTDKVHAN